MATSKKLIPLHQLLRALADPTRLRLIHLIAQQEICVCYFVQVLGAPQPKISRHLAYLRRAGIVAARREGKWMHYRLLMPSESHAAAILQAVVAALQQDKSLQRDLDRLGRACCGPRSLVQVMGAPIPAQISASSSLLAAMPLSRES